MTRLADLLTLLLLTSPIWAQNQESSPPTESSAKSPQGHGQPASEAPSDPTGLPETVVASLDGDPIDQVAFLAYLGTVHARHETGRRALDQLVVEAVLNQRAGLAAVTITESDVDELYEQFELRAREASGGATGLLEAAGGDAGLENLRHTLRLAALQRALVAFEDGVDDADSLSDIRLSQWMDAAIADAQVTEAPLNHVLSARFAGGEISKAQLGARLVRLLPDDEISAVLTELLGLIAIGRHAESLDIPYTKDLAVAELAERERLVHATPAATGLTYEDYLRQLEDISIEELLGSPRFRAEVLMVAIVDAEWDAAALVSMFEELSEPLVERFGEDVTLDQALPTLLREARQRSYQRIMASSRIVRRF